VTLAERLQLQPFQGYAYSYPHKMAYRRFDPVLPLQPLWEREDRDSLFLYVHIPFCEMRCGFCNLFTTTSDMFPRRAVGSVVGIGGMAGAVGGMMIARLVGEILQRTGSYVPIFIIAASTYLVALLLFHLLSPKLDPAKL